VPIHGNPGPNADFERIVGTGSSAGAGSRWRRLRFLCISLPNRLRAKRSALRLNCFHVVSWEAQQDRLLWRLRKCRMRCLNRRHRCEFG
jgi:hypothetical protein